MIGSAQAAVLTVLAGADGLTITEVAGHLGWQYVTAQRAVARLGHKRYAEVLHRGPGTRAAAWGATSAGRRALAARGVVVPSLPEPPPVDAVPVREGECGRCRYLKTARGHHAACGAQS